jgi:hypothetical protein
MKDVIANLDNDWRLTGDEVEAYLRQRGALRPIDGARL